MVLRAVSFKNSRGLMLRGFVNEPKKYDTAVIFLHGFPSRCKGFTGTRISKALQKTNYLFLAFDFSHTDTSDGKFEDKLISNEIKDIKAAIDFLYGKYSFTKLVLVGHSTGAINTALYSYKDKRIDRIVLIAGTGNLKEGVRYEFTPLHVRDFWKKGYMTYDAPGKWYHKKKMKKAYYDEFFKLDVLGSLKKFKGPVLIIHGERDEAVSSDKDPHELYKAATRPKKLVIIKDANHQFTKPVHWRKLLLLINKFIRK